MADTKISALPAATTPLAGTEVLPIVQGGTTDKVSVANLTAGRTVAGLGFDASNASGAAYSSISAPSTSQAGLLFKESGTNKWNVYKDSSAGANLVFFGSVETLRLDQSNGNVTFVSNNLIQGTAAKGINFTANTPAAGMTSQLLNWYEEGTYTPTVTGFSADPVGMTARYTRVGRAVTVQIYMPNAGTSNSVGFTVSLPFASGFTFQGVLGQATNNSAATTCVGYLTATSSTLTLYEGVGNNWASTNGKAANISFTYFV